MMPFVLPQLELKVGKLYVVTWITSSDNYEPAIPSDSNLPDVTYSFVKIGIISFPTKILWKGSNTSKDEDRGVVTGDFYFDTIFMVLEVTSTDPRSFRIIQSSEKHGCGVGFVELDLRSNPEPTRRDQCQVWECVVS